MKKLISILLVAVMLVAMVPAMAFTTSADTTAVEPSGKWTDAGNYDISWCKTLDTADSSKTVTIGDKNYHVMGDWTHQTYTIDTPQKLAGLAYLSELTSGDCFKGDDFVITADLDLSAHYWIPICMTKGKFRGSIIGQKDNVEGASVTINGMTINTASSARTGLVGNFGGDWIKNIDLVNAKITATDFTVGSFVGWQNGNLGSGSGNQGGYQNLSSDAEIILTSQRTGDQYDDVGGIVGVSNSCNANNKSAIIDDCVFTGTISAPYADNVGGIVGLWQNTGIGISITNCVVISDRIEWGKDNVYLQSKAGHNVGCGGIAGNLYSNSSSDAVNVSNCYVAANIITLAATNTTNYTETINVGGIVGASCSQTKTFDNCQFDGIITGKSGALGAVLGRIVANTDINNIKNTVVTGVGMRSAGDVSTYVGGATGGLTVTNCYNSIEMVTGNSGATLAPITANTDFSALLAITVSETDSTKVWTKGENDLYPILAIAVPYLNADTNGTPSIAKSGVDLSWATFDEGMKICNDSQLMGLDLINDVHKTTGTNLMAKATVNPSFANVKADLSGYSEAVQNFVKSELGVSDNVDTAKSLVNMDKSIMQKALDQNENGTYNIRFVLLVKGADHQGITVEVGASRTNDGVVQYGKFLESESITSCYKQVVEDGNTLTAATEAGEEGWYYVAFVVKNVDTSIATTFTVRANVTLSDGTVTQSVAANYTTK